ncbi:Rv3654c family TadE-like protein [Mycolicibacterium elephantis]|uniref:Rv3654c family TadE-like protein n=1 Tax=Mycolicibacterium elephantis TaxID=81858 RepID=UPI0027E270DF|nr:Rv3654c family TadE-like protein [Mycolicibacterium elephantis]
MCGVKADGWSRRSARDRRCYRASPSRRGRWRRRNPARGEDGSATLVGVAAMAVLLAVTVGAVYVGAAVIGRHRAQAAADLAALAAASSMVDGSAAACSRATEIAHAMDATVAHCAVENLDVVVAVDVDVSVGRLAVGPARAVARAGPVETNHAASSKLQLLRKSASSTHNNGSLDAHTG